MEKKHVGRPRRRQMPWARQMRLLLFGGLLLLVTPVVVLGIMKHLDDLALERHREALRARGVPITFEDLKARHAPSVPAASEPVSATESDSVSSDTEEAGTNFLAHAFEHMVPLANHPSEAILRRLQRDLETGASPTPEQMDALRDYLSDNAEALQLLREAADRRPGRFPLDYGKGYALGFRHAPIISHAVNLLQADVFLAALENDPDRSYGSLLSALAVAATLHGEPFVVSGMAHRDAVNAAMTALAVVLARTTLTDGQLMDLQRALEAAHRPNAFAAAIEAERVRILSAFDNPVAAPDAGEAQPDDFISGFYAAALRTPFAFGWFSGDRRELLRRMDELAEAAALPFPEARIVYDRIGAEAARFSLFLNLTNLLIPYLSQAPHAFARETARLNQGIVGLAVERYRIEHGEPPDGLDVLTPQYLEEVPADPFDGRPLRYRREDDGYVIYTVGPGLDHTARAIKPVAAPAVSGSPVLRPTAIDLAVRTTALISDLAFRVVR